MSVVLFSQLLIFELIQQADRLPSCNFSTFSKSQKSHFEYFEKEIDYLVPFDLFFSLKSCNAFRIVQCK